MNISIKSKRKKKNKRNFMKKNKIEFLQATISSMQDMLQGSGAISKANLTSHIARAKKELETLQQESDQDFEDDGPSMKDMIGYSGPDLIDTIICLAELIKDPTQNNCDWLRYHLQRSTQGWPDEGAEGARMLSETVEEAIALLKIK
jgi:hypothetical protein